jgi:hypothetical protein
MRERCAWFIVRARKRKELNILVPQSEWVLLFIHLLFFKSSWGSATCLSLAHTRTQVLFDILPLRLVPPLVFGGIVYRLVGLVPTVPGFWKFMLTLVLFNLTTASVVLWLSIAFASVSVASLVGTLVMLFKYVFVCMLTDLD